MSSWEGLDASSCQFAETFPGPILLRKKQTRPTGITKRPRTTNPNDALRTDDLISMPTGPEQNIIIWKGQIQTSGELPPDDDDHNDDDDDDDDDLSRPGPETGMLWQAETQPVSQEQMMIEIKGNYAGLAISEPICKDIEEPKFAAAQETDSAGRTELKCIL